MGPVSKRQPFFLLSYGPFCGKVKEENNQKRGVHMDNHIFRSAIGGFNRQDVMEYIERVQKRAEEEASALEAQTEELRRANEGLEQQLEERTRERDGLEQQLEEMTLRCNHARNNWDAQAQAKESFRRDVAQRDEKIRGLNEENQRLLRQVEALEQQMDSFRRQKEQLAQLELEARQRSGDVLAQAEAQAQEALAQARAEAEAIVSRANAQAESAVSQAQAQAESTVARANSQAEETIAQAEAQAEATATRANARADMLLRETEERIGATAAEYDQLFRTFQSVSGRISNEVRKLGETASQLPASFNRLKDGLAELQTKAKER